MPTISFATVAAVAGVAVAATAVGVTLGVRFATRPGSEPAPAPKPPSNDEPAYHEEAVSTDVSAWANDPDSDVAELVTELEELDGTMPEDTLDSGAIAAARGMGRVQQYSEIPGSADDEEDGEYERTVLYSEDTWREHMENLRD